MLARVIDDISFLQTPTDKFQLRLDDHCLDIYTTEARLILYEKMIWKKYRPLKSELMPEGELKSACRVEFTEIRTKKKNTSELNLGNKNTTSSTASSADEKTKSELLLTAGKTGSINFGNKAVTVECSETLGEIFQLSFYIGEKGKTSIQTSITVKKGEIVNAGNIKNELEDKIKKIGIPNTEIRNENVNEDIKYELVVH